MESTVEVPGSTPWGAAAAAAAAAGVAADSVAADAAHVLVELHGEDDEGAGSSAWLVRVANATARALRAALASPELPVRQEEEREAVLRAAAAPGDDEGFSCSVCGCARRAQEAHCANASAGSHGVLGLICASCAERVPGEYRLLSQSAYAYGGTAAVALQRLYLCDHCGFVSSAKHKMASAAATEMPRQLIERRTAMDLELELLAALAYHLHVPLLVLCLPCSTCSPERVPYFDFPDRAGARQGTCVHRRQVERVNRYFINSRDLRTLEGVVFHAATAATAGGPMAMVVVGAAPTLFPVAPPVPVPAPLPLPAPAPAPVPGPSVLALPLAMPMPMPMHMPPPPLAAPTLPALAETLSHVAAAFELRAHVRGAVRFDDRMYDAIMPPGGPQEALRALRWLHREVGGIDTLHELAAFLAHSAFVASSFAFGARGGHGPARLRWDDVGAAGVAFVAWAETLLQCPVALHPGFLAERPELLGGGGSALLGVWTALWHWAKVRDAAAPGPALVAGLRRGSYAALLRMALHPSLVLDMADAARRALPGAVAASRRHRAIHENAMHALEVEAGAASTTHAASCPADARHLDAARAELDAALHDVRDQDGAVAAAKRVCDHVDALLILEETAPVG